jgi:hypothetical protein
VNHTENVEPVAQAVYFVRDVSNYQARPGFHVRIFVMTTRTSQFARRQQAYPTSGVAQKKHGLRQLFCRGYGSGICIQYRCGTLRKRIGHAGKNLHQSSDYQTVTQRPAEMHELAWCKRSAHTSFAVQKQPLELEPLLCSSQLCFAVPGMSFLHTQRLANLATEQ